uniref:protein-tyrosine-phosphatase n=1 Tax=Eubacterium cellulosolvens (strain ATCC 43171 / JCM 9499 / 6) TaxID=633697 RepID=I5AW92_EUBC6
MIKILFVCHGNICRSPMAEFVMKDMVRKAQLSDCFEIASAATSSEEIWNGVGNPVYPPARQIMKEHGISCEGKRARQMKKSDYEYYDLLIGMDQANIRNMTRIAGGDPEHKIKRLLDYTDAPRDVADPWYTRDFETTWQDVNEGCRAMLEALREVQK